MADKQESESETPPTVDLSKADATGDADAAGTAARAEGSDAALPRSMQYALGAIITQLALALLYAILSWPLAGQLHDAVITSNRKQKTPKVLCDVKQVAGCLDVTKTVHAIQRSTLIITLVIGAVIVLLFPRIRKGIRSSRSIYVAVTIVGAMLGFSASPLSIVAVFSSGPVLPRVVAVVGAITSILAIVWLFARDSAQYFNLKSPNPLGPRPGLGSLFRPRPPRAPAERVPGTRSVPKRGDQRSDAPIDRRAGARAARVEARASSRAKSRQDADAVARGAELARNRAKASKSRRTDS